MSLAACCERWLKRPLDKTDQTSNWSGDLTDCQLQYAATDALVLLPLARILTQEMAENDLTDIANLEHRCLPAMVWMAHSGVPMDHAAWHKLEQTAHTEAETARHQLDQEAPVRPSEELFPEPWNWNSPPQVQQAFQLVGMKLDNTSEETLSRIDHPLAKTLLTFRQAGKRSTTYGKAWLAHVHSDGRIYPNWWQLGAASGRMSCSSPNMQQLPRGVYRRCVAPTRGRVLIKADYSQIELRIAAKVSGDEALIQTYLQGLDLHAHTAQAVLGVETVTKEHRRLAKAINFGLVFGMGARGFRQYAQAQYGIALSEAEAHQYRSAFFRSYPGLAQWHRRVKRRRDMSTRTLAGRRRLLHDDSPDTHRLNSPVQGTGADGLKSALALLWERRDQVPESAFPVMAIHDEIVIECDQADAEQVTAWLQQGMLDGMNPLLDPVPVEVECQIGTSWAGE